MSSAAVRAHNTRQPTTPGRPCSPLVLGSDEAAGYLPIASSIGYGGALSDWSGSLGAVSMIQESQGNDLRVSDVHPAAALVRY